MVLAERNTDTLRNGRRSRGPSPNGHASDTSSDGESIGEGGTRSLTHGHVVPEEKIRVGRDYQAVCPGLVPVCERRLELVPDKALLVWSPTVNIPDVKLDEYICLAKEKYGYNGEQALGMLFWHKHDLERAIMDLSNFTPFPDEWTVEDKVLFEQAFQFHGKSFHRIRQMLPDKTIASLVKYYYSWKKTRTRTSLMDRQARKIATNRDEGSEVGSEHGSNTDSDGEDKVKTNVSIEGHITGGSDKGKFARNKILQPSDKPINKSVSVDSNIDVSLERSNVKSAKRSHSQIQACEKSLGTDDDDNTKISPRKRLCLLDRPAPRIVKLNRAFKKAEAESEQKSFIKEESVKFGNTDDNHMNNCDSILVSSDPIKPIIQIATTV